MRIANVRSWRTHTGTSHVEADVDGEPLWFASDDANLVASPEAFASTVLIAAATRGEPLEIDAPVDRLWLQRVPGILRQAEIWWRLPGTCVIPKDVVDVPRERPGVTAQCFTGGVDSFYALVSAEAWPGMLVYAHGFDNKPDDRARLDAFLPGFREVAAAFRARPVVVSTNLRWHRTSRGVDFRRSHGGALAALGHVLSGNVEQILIPSSYPYHDPKPWGSHWDLDPLWSSRRLAVEHADATFRRGKKVQAIADQELVRRHLRVCPARKTPRGNCSKCEKCVRTMIAFAICGKLEGCEAFDLTVPLEQRVSNLPILEPELVSIYEELICEIDDPRLKIAVDRLIADSQGKPGWYYNWLRRWRKKLTRMWGRLASPLRCRAAREPASPGTGSKAGDRGG